MGKTDRKKVPKTAWGLGRESAVEPVSIVLNSLFRYTSSWYTLWLVYFWQFTSTLTSFTWLRARRINIGNRSAARGFSEPNSLSFPSFFSSASLVTIKQSLPTSVGKNTIAIFFAILNSQELSSVFSAKSVVTWKPKIPSMFGKRAARYNEYCCKQRNFMLLSWQYLSSNQFSGQIFWDNSYRDQIFKENLLYSKMWSNNYMYSVLVKDYRCTLTFAYVVPRKLY